MLIETPVMRCVLPKAVALDERLDDLDAVGRAQLVHEQIMRERSRIVKHEDGALSALVGHKDSADNAGAGALRKGARHGPFRCLARDWRNGPFHSSGLAADELSGRSKPSLF